MNYAVMNKVTGFITLTTAINQDGTFGYLPPYSTDAAASLEVVQNMRERGFEFAIESNITGYHVRFFRPIEGTYGEADCGSISEAVCKAALFAMLEDEE